MARSGIGLFRERALEQGDVREALDERVRIVGISRWIQLAIGVSVIVGFVVWSASKDVQTTFRVEGIMSTEQGLHSVATPVSGTVLTAPPPRGTRVKPGDVVATIDTGRSAPVEVRAVTEGSIENVAAGPGSFVAAGAELAALEPTHIHPVAFVFVPTDRASRLEVGEQTLLSPAVDESRATGLLEGRIGRIADYDASPQRLQLLLGPGLASQFAGGPPVREVEVQLIPDPSTPSGFAWTKGRGPREIRIGSHLTGRVVMSKKSPLSYVF